MLKFFMAEEWKSKYASAAAFLFIFTAVLITYLSLPGIEQQQYSAIFWIVLVFTTLQGISRSFIQMRKNSYVFWHQLCSPFEFLAARLISSAMLMLIFTLFAFAVFALMHGLPEQGSLMFLLVCVLTGSGVASIFTISSSIASKTDNPGVLLPVLTFPVILPVILIGSKAGKKALDGLETIVMLPDLFILLAFNVLIAGMGLVLIRFIWKE